MKIDSERLDQIQSLLALNTEKEDAMTFYVVGTKPKEGYWYVNANTINLSGPQNDDGDSDWYKSDMDRDVFLDFASEHDLVAVTTLYRPVAGYDENTFTEWEHLSNFLGIGKLVAVSTKIPATVERKFKYFATKEGTESSVLRKLVYEYVRLQIVANANRLLVADEVI